MKKQIIPSNSIENVAVELFGLSTEDLLSLHSEFRNDHWFVDVTLIPRYPPCPRCGTENPAISNYVSKQITHSVLQDRKCTLLYHARRYKCPFCQRTYYEENPFTFKKQRISKATVRGILEALISPSATFSSVAQQYHVSPTTVQNIFDDQIIYPPASHLPRVMQIDETYSFRSENSKYVCMLLDYDTQRPVDVLPSRKKADLITYFKTFPRSERSKVRYIAADMYKTYYEVCSALFPRAVYAVDRFHVVQEFDRCFDRIRVRVMKGQKSDTVEYGLLKHRNGLLKFSPDFKIQAEDPANANKKIWVRLFDPTAPREYVYQTKSRLNAYEIREKILNISPELREAWLFRIELQNFFKKYTIENAAAKLRKMQKEMEESGIEEMIHFSGTVMTWFNQIVNSFSIVKEEYEVDPKNGKLKKVTHRLNSSMIENRNKLVKQVKNNANGYTNWDRFRNRVLYVLNKGKPPEEIIPSEKHS